MKLIALAALLLVSTSLCGQSVVSGIDPAAGVVAGDERDITAPVHLGGEAHTSVAGITPAVNGAVAFWARYPNGVPSSVFATTLTPSGETTSTRELPGIHPSYPTWIKAIPAVDGALLFWSTLTDGVATIRFVLVRADLTLRIEPQVIATPAYAFPQAGDCDDSGCILTWAEPQNDGTTAVHAATISHDGQLQTTALILNDAVVTSVTRGPHGALMSYEPHPYYSGKISVAIVRDDLTMTPLAPPQAGESDVSAAVSTRTSEGFLLLWMHGSELEGAVLDDRGVLLATRTIRSLTLDEYPSRLTVTSSGQERLVVLTTDRPVFVFEGVDIPHDLASIRISEAMDPLDSDALPLSTNPEGNFEASAIHTASGFLVAFSGGTLGYGYPEARVTFVGPGANAPVADAVVGARALSPVPVSALLRAVAANDDGYLLSTVFTDRWLVHGPGLLTRLDRDGQPVAPPTPIRVESRVVAAGHDYGLLVWNEALRKDFLSRLDGTTGDLVLGQPLAIDRFYDTDTPYLETMVSDGSSFDALYDRWAGGNVHELHTVHFTTSGTIIRDLVLLRTATSDNQIGRLSAAASGGHLLVACSLQKGPTTLSVIDNGSGQAITTELSADAIPIHVATDGNHLFLLRESPFHDLILTRVDGNAHSLDGGGIVVANVPDGADQWRLTRFTDNSVLVAWAGGTVRWHAARVDFRNHASGPSFPLDTANHPFMDFVRRPGRDGAMAFFLHLVSEDGVVLPVISEQELLPGTIPARRRAAGDS